MISCNQYDYLEIACMYHFPLRLVLLDGSIVEGIASDTGYNTHKQECLIIESNGEPRFIPTEQLKSLRVTIDNPHFSSVEFQQ
ncbi:transcriptional antiterminator [Vibrio ponticus]|uniref:Transcriptional antiterminator n=1 Tax=Vibrio ponticus TaxID=265668 RepID=A0ABX3FG20_9VIBR|nr:Rho-binding antiterminator [Vibrio ponticus]OLQ91606.1 transcriptional antiterminator [Vibrio ponticus]